MLDLIRQILICFLSMIQIDLPDSLANKLFGTENLETVAIKLQMHMSPFDIPAYDTFWRNDKNRIGFDEPTYQFIKKNFYESMVLPPAEELMIFDLGDRPYENKYPLINYPVCGSWWLTHKIVSIREISNYYYGIKSKYMEYLTKEDINDIDNRIKYLNYLIEIYDKADDTCRYRASMLYRRRALKYLKENLGEKNYYNRKLPEPWIPFKIE